MKHKPISIYSLTIVCFLSIAVFFSCKKSDPLTIPPELGTFTNQTSGTYFVTGPGVTYEIPVGVTTVSDQDRTITFTVSSPTGATEGAFYTLPSKSVVIPKGQTTGTIVLSGEYSQYTAGRKDTLIFTLVTPSVKPSDYNGTYTLLMRGPCFDGDVTLSDIGGDFTQTFENGSYGPYTTSITGLTLTGATTGTGTFNNLYDNFGPVTINFDWTDPTNTKVSIPLQITDKEYDTDQPFYVRTKPTGSNKFSVCNQRLSFILDVLVEIDGSLYYYDNGVVYTMGR